MTNSTADNVAEDCAELATNSAPKRRRLNRTESENKQSDEQQSENKTDTNPDEKKRPSLVDVFDGKDPWKLKVKELKELCKSKGLKVGGNKTELVTRLLTPTTAASRKGGKRTTAKQVHAMLRSAGIDDPDGVNPCLKRGIQRGYFVVDGAASLDTVILEGHCVNCPKKVAVTIRDALYQAPFGGDYEEGSEGGAVECKGDSTTRSVYEDYCSRQYITRLCEGKPELNNGKFHNHCEECPGFGECIGDYREAHCEHCGEHYFCGLSGFSCPCQGMEDPEDEGVSFALFSALMGW